MLGRIGGTISNTWDLMSSSFSILRKDKELLVFSLLSGIGCLLVLASFALPLYETIPDAAPEQGGSNGLSPRAYVIYFLFYFCMYFVIIFFNTATVACAIKRLRGNDPTLGDGLRIATERLHYILGWTLVSSTVGLLLRSLEESDGIGGLLSGILGMVWTLIAFLAVPVFTVEKVGPIKALTRSSTLLKETWGQQIMGNFSFEIMFMLLSIPAFLILMLGVGSGSTVLMILSFVAAGLYLGTVAAVEATLQAIFRAVVYVYASDHELPEEFDESQMEGMVRHRR